MITNITIITVALSSPQKLPTVHLLERLKVKPSTRSKTCFADEFVNGGDDGGMSHPRDPVHH